jgi:hypothetical protein
MDLEKSYFDLFYRGLVRTNDDQLSFYLLSSQEMTVVVMLVQRNCTVVE